MKYIVQGRGQTWANKKLNTKDV